LGNQIVRSSANNSGFAWNARVGFRANIIWPMLILDAAYQYTQLIGTDQWQLAPALLPSQVTPFNQLKADDAYANSLTIGLTLLFG
jgi:hypothetical protein